MDETAQEPSKPMATFYLDQNIVGYLADGSFRLPKGFVVPVISSEHFNEIARGDSLHLLDTLEEIEAQELIVSLDDQRRVTDEATLSPPGGMRARYAEHVANIEQGKAHIGTFQSLVARTWGADNQQSLLDQLSTLPEAVLPQEEMTANPEIGAEAQRVAKLLIETARSRLAKTTPLTALRKMLGTDRGRAGDGDPAGAVQRIWESIAPRLPGITMDQFFWKEPIDRLGYDRWPFYLAVISCHAMLNTLGFRPDKGMSERECTAGILSDGIHLANAAFCNALVTADRRLVDKAKAIYFYLGVTTQVLKVAAARSA